MNELFKKPGPVDMSPEAIAQRLGDLQQLYLLSMSLSHARFVDATEQKSADAVRSGQGIALSEEASTSGPPTSSAAQRAT
jgi:hypothetical protein